MKDYSLNIGGREIPLILSTYELADIQEEIGCTAAQMQDQVFGIERVIEDEQEKTLFHVAENPEMMRKFAKLIRICGNAALEEKGETPDLTDKWIMRRIKPGNIIVYALIMMGLIVDAMKTEIGSMKKDDGPVDEILEEENRKKEQGSSHTGESAPTGSSPD